MKVLYSLFLLLLLVSLSHQAPERDCICTADYTPVCGTNGKTYSNACRLRCAGVEMAHKGECGKGSKL